MRFPVEFKRGVFCLALIYAPNLSGTHGLYKRRTVHIRGGSVELISAEIRPPTRYKGAVAGAEEAELSAPVPPPPHPPSTTYSHISFLGCAVLTQRSGALDIGNKPVFLGGAEQSCFHPPGPLLSPLSSCSFQGPLFCSGPGFHLPSPSSASHRFLPILPPLDSLHSPLSPALYPLHVPSAVGTSGHPALWD